MALMKRNTLNDFKNATEPLSKPMSVKERKLRSKIRRKCKIYIYELALAEYCGLIPDREMRKAGINNVHEAIENISWRLTFEAFRERQNPS